MKTSHIQNVQEKELYIQTHGIRWKISILEKFRKKSYQIEVYTREKYQLQILIPD
jgi:hypothetical protein